MFEYVLILLMFNAQGEFGALYRGFHTESECHAARSAVILEAPDLALEDGSKAARFSAECMPTRAVPLRT